MPQDVAALRATLSLAPVIPVLVLEVPEAPEAMLPRKHLVFAELDAHTARLRESGALAPHGDTEFQYNREELFARLREPVEKRLGESFPAGLTDPAQVLTRARIPAVAYHAGLDDAHRHEVQDAFMREDVRVIVATNAFGMGIDKANVRLVVHPTFDVRRDDAGRLQPPARPTLKAAPVETVIGGPLRRYQGTVGPVDGGAMDREGGLRDRDHLGGLHVRLQLADGELEPGHVVGPERRVVAEVRGAGMQVALVGPVVDDLGIDRQVPIERRRLR